MKCFKMWICKIEKVNFYTKIDKKKLHGLMGIF